MALQQALTVTAFPQEGTAALRVLRPDGLHAAPPAAPPERSARRSPPPAAEDPSRQRTNRKIALLQRCGLFGGKDAGVAITRACSPEELCDAYALVHEIFVEQGYCHPTAYGMRLRVFEATPQMATFVAKAEGKVVGVLSVVGDSEDCGLPSDQVYRPELDGLRGESDGNHLCEWSNQVVAHDFRKTNVPTELMRCAAAHVIKAGYSHSVISVSSVHSGFYELLGFHQIGPKRSYSTDVEDPVIPLCLPSEAYLSADTHPDEVTDFIRRFMAEENPHLEHIDHWENAARQMFSDPAQLRRLFAQRSSFLRHCGLGSQATLVHQWSKRVYSDVMGDTLPSSIVAWLRSLYDILPALPRRRS